MRTAFLIDGFNLYHSMRDTERILKTTPLQWLDMPGLCRAVLSALPRTFSLGPLHYFSALATHAADPGKVARHKFYISVLEAQGAIIHLGRFKEKKVYCHNCRKDIVKHEEKETDVAIACTLLELLHGGQCDAVVIMTGDSDLAPAVRTARTLFPSCEIAFAFPYLRHHAELKHLAPLSIKLTPRAYKSNQLPSPLTLPDGRTVTKPATW